MSINLETEAQYPDNIKAVRNKIYQLHEDFGKNGPTHLQKNLDRIIIFQSKRGQNITGNKYTEEDVEKFRGTKLRGVSKNGRNNWQILCFEESNKVYLGTVDDIVKAALLYDIFSIQFKGRKAKTNFSYTMRELIAIMSIQSLMSIKNKIVN